MGGLKRGPPPIPSSSSKAARRLLWWWGRCIWAWAAVRSFQTLHHSPTTPPILILHPATHNTHTLTIQAHARVTTSCRSPSQSGSSVDPDRLRPSSRDNPFKKETPKPTGTSTTSSSITVFVVVAAVARVIDRPEGPWLHRCVCCVCVCVRVS
jgi:hypothetical protein